VTPLLGQDDPPPFVVTNPGAPSPFLLIGDHAGRIIPRGLDGLGVPPAEMDRHIAWDIGVAGMGERMAGLLDATFIRQTYSRLVIDCNRTPERADAMPEVSDGTAIPANVGLSNEDRAARRAAIFQPYHDRIAAELDARAGRPTLIVALHSFTPVMAGFVRPWKYGVLHLHDSALSLRMLSLFQAEFGDAAGDNEPYSMDGTDYTVPFHAIARGLDYIEIETRQDLIGDAAGQETAAVLLSKMLTAATKP
jgi:predicted N-formylglutamate amidohydrolase